MSQNNKSIRKKASAAKAAGRLHLLKFPRTGAGDAHSVSAGVFRKKGYPLHLHISFVYTLLIVLLLSIIGVFNYLEARKNALQVGRQVFMRINDEIKSNLRHLQDTSTEALFYLYQSPAIGSREFADKLKLAPLMGAALQFHPELSSIAVGYDNGDFFRFSRAARFGELSAEPVPQGAKYLIRSYEGPKEYQEFFYLDHHFEIVKQWNVPHDGYDPRTRDWYRHALTADTAVSTRPYFLHAGKWLGTSVSQAGANRDMAISIAFPLAGIDRIFDATRTTNTSSLLVFDTEDTVLYSSELDIAIKEVPNSEPSPFTLSELNYPLRHAIKDAITAESFNTPLRARADGKEFLFAVSPLMDAAVGGTRYYVAISSPASAVLPDAAGLIWRQGLFTLLALALAVPASWLFSRRLSKGLVALSEVARDARNFSFSLKPPAASSVAELNELSRSIYHANNTLKRFLDINAVIAQERDYGSLLDTVLRETMGTVDAVAGILYLLSEDGKGLIPTAAKRTHPANGNGPAVHPAGAFLDSLPIIAAAGVGLAPHLAEALKGIPQTGLSAREDWPSEAMRTMFPEPHMQLIATPLVYNHKVTGVLCLYRHSAKEAPNRDMLSFIGRLSGGAAVAIENHRLIVEQKRLFDAFIRLIAASIDSKSRYTGGHCQRVPVIAKMLADAVDEAAEGPFADSRFEEKNREVLRVASWLHDCGKIITPEHVVDKATKLETIHNRIHEVRMRFEVLKRDAETAYYRALLKGADETAAREELHAEWARLDDDFAFVAKCNIGDKKITPEHLRRLREIAARTWNRTISDRLGISEAEKKRRKDSSEEALPAKEHILADKPEHLIERDEADGGRSGRQFAFTLRPPEHKYNLGEIANLSIVGGTLTEEERYVINNHVMQTMIILSHLPFPEEYGDIVGVAGSHHERMDARGYPRGISGEAMSIEARIIAIADVFEALTAADRPYKKAKTLSESLGIMSRMAEGGHLDPDLFAVFIRSGVHLRYAEHYLEKRQIDVVDAGGVRARI